VNGGLARSGSRRVKPSAATSSKRTARVELTAKPGEDRRKAQGDERSSSSGSHIAKKRCVSRGTRVVRATGSYEESLSMEGIPDHHEASAFTRRRQRWSRRLSHPPTRSKPSKRGTDGQRLQRSRKGARREGETGVATGVSEARSRQHRGKKTPTLVSPGREAVELEKSARTTIRRSGHRAP
jgi:hypothetical protein